MKTKRIAKATQELVLIVFSTVLFLGSTCLFAQNELTDLQISNAVDKHLMINAVTPSHLIDVATIDGIVTLEGTVNNILAKEHSIKVAQMVKGVKGVIDKIEVSPIYVSDNVLERNIKNALFKDPATSSYKIHVKANNGVVTLDGEVSSWQEKQIASYVAKGVLGVKEVHNDVDIDLTTERSDFEIEQDIEQALRYNVKVDHVLIDVEVDEGKVTLSGIVGSIPEKNLAIADAWVLGVQSVKSDDLDVNEWARHDDLRRDKYVYKTDQEIKEAVNNAFLYDPRVLHFNPDIMVNNGHVTLSGVVTNLKAKYAAENTARNIVGVFGVSNNLKVRPVIIPEDSKLQENVSESLQQSPVLGNRDIHVSADNGNVYLTGVVNSIFEKSLAENTTAGTNGVVEVYNYLVVQGGEEQAYYDYYGWNTYYPPLYDINRVRTRSDREIESNIENQLWWSPYVSLDDIDVTVNNGKVFLEGIVETLREKRFAEINALQGGAREVENNLIVIYTP